MTTMTSLLYIPFWLYSNEKHCAQSGESKNFTFHSGYIPMDYDRILAYLSKLYIPFWLYSNWKARLTVPDTLNFTFHSGYIPIELWVHPILLWQPLHSILVIFQSVSYHTTYLRHLKPYFLSTSIFSTGKVWFSCNSTVYVLL